MYFFLRTIYILIFHLILADILILCTGSSKVMVNNISSDKRTEFISMYNERCAYLQKNSV